jgi:hypothetical protein
MAVDEIGVCVNVPLLGSPDQVVVVDVGSHRPSP